MAGRVISLLVIASVMALAMAEAPAEVQNRKVRPLSHERLCILADLSVW
jgi:hypothetical protein